MPFLTLEDPNAKIKGSRDPLGMVPVWSGFGRHVVTNLTTQSTSVRGFTTLLLGRYFAAKLIDDGTIPIEEAMNVTLRMEQVAAYARHVGYGVEGEIRGIERVKRFLDDTGGRPPIQADRTGQILSDQKVYGLWGLYSVPARLSGLIPDGPSHVTEPARDLIERCYLPLLEPCWKPLLRLLAAGGTLDTREGKDPMFAALKNVFRETFTGIETDFYGDYLRDASHVREAVPERQKRFRELLEATIDLGESGSPREELVGLANEAAKYDDDLAERLKRILHLEAFLAPAASLFEHVLTRKGQRPEDVAESARERWGARVPNLDGGAFAALGAEIRAASSPETGASMSRCHAALAEGRYADAIRALLDWNRQVMARRSAGPWVTLAENGRLDVRLVAVEQPMPDEDDLPTLWRNSYFIDSLKSVTRQLRRAA